MSILVTGGMGYIGSHTVIQLIESGYDVVILDNLSNSKIEVLDKIEALAGARPKFYQSDLLDKEATNKVFEENIIDAVIHFAGFKAVGESVEIPLDYYYNNVTGTIVLCEVMKNHGCKNIVFSSSATVYGMNNTAPFVETMPLSTTNPYGSTKLMCEMILNDICISDPTWSVCLLRYFNPIGAHPSGLIGEDPNGIPNNLLPYVAQVATGKLKQLSVFGNDYDTVDGTGVRDYIHVCDLASGHVAAIKYVIEHTGSEAINLGTGNGQSVLEVVAAFEKASNLKINYRIVDRRAGDIGTCYASTDKAKELLGWQAEKSLDDMCIDTWRFASHHYLDK